MSNFFFGGLRRAAGQKAVGPTSAAIVGPTDVPTLARRWPNVSMLSGSDRDTRINKWLFRNQWIDDIYRYFGGSKDVSI